MLTYIFPLKAPTGIHLAYSSFKGSASKSKTVFDLAVCCCKGLTAYDDKHAYYRFTTIMTTGRGKEIHERNKVQSLEVIGVRGYRGCIGVYMGVYVGMYGLYGPI